MLKSSNLMGDIYGGITAAVVALPLALAFGVASGVSPIAGLYGAIAVGFFAAIFGGTNTQVSGPTGPMTVVMAAIVAEHADHLSEAFAIVFLGGIFQILFGVLRLGRYVSYTPYSVVSGFMSGIGVIIILIQLLPFLGHATAGGGPVGAVQALPGALSTPNLHALVIAAVSLVIMIFWPKRLAALLPSSLVVLIVGTLMALFLFPQAPLIGDVPTGLPKILPPDIGLGNIAGLIQPALILALLGSIDSLLTSLVADSITRTRHNSDRELIGQGLGNMVSGLIGGLPGAGATMRTVVNIRAGASSKISGALHSIVLLSLVLGLAPLAEKIPHAVLAGILLKVGWDIIDWGYLKRIRRAPKDKVLVMLLTLFLTVFVDLITAVGVGLIVAGFVTARWMETEELKGVTAVALPEFTDGAGSWSEDEIAKYDGRIGLFAFRGRFSYASARKLVHEIGGAVGTHEIVLFDFSEAAHVDTSAALAIEELIEDAADREHGCGIFGLNGDARKTLEDLGVLKNLPADRICDDRAKALATAAELIGG